MDRTKSSTRILNFLVFLLVLGIDARGRDITFCGEVIPVNKDFVAHKLMKVIRSQINYLDMPRLRRESKAYFPMIEYYLRKTGLPEDLEYIPIVESNFRNATSPVGAQGFWQLMPETAIDWGLRVTSTVDERNDIYKATLAACKELARLYKSIKRQYNISSWTLVAASYNYGIGNMFQNINRQGTNYFSMKLNEETALYVYKLIAVKELFEYPETYINFFKYNIFDPRAKKQLFAEEKTDKADEALFKEAEIKVNEKDEEHPEEIKIDDVAKPETKDLAVKKKISTKSTLVNAHIYGSYGTFKEGDEIKIQLQDNLTTREFFLKKGQLITGKGWIIDNRVFIDLGLGGPKVILYDAQSNQGVGLDKLNDREQVLLRVQQ